MPNAPENPLIIQGDRSILLDAHAPRAAEARAALIPFAELEKSPEHLHTYRITPLSLWNAASAGFSPEGIAATLEDFARYPVPQAVGKWIIETMSRFGKIRLVAAPPVSAAVASTPPVPTVTAAQAPASPGAGDSGASEVPDAMDEQLLLIVSTPMIFRELAASRAMAKYLTPEPGAEMTFRLALLDRGTVKQELLTLGWPVKDEAPLRDGDPLEIGLRQTCSSGKPLVIRDYQREAADALVGDRGPGTGFGTIVLPCGAGKTVVGMTVMSLLKTNTLILTTNVAAVHQWIDELLDKTDLSPDDIGEYSGDSKEIKPVTIATYQILTWRASKDGSFPHFSLFRSRGWGLIIYDEVHLLPAPVFRVTAELQAVRRLGLTATLVREDGNEGAVFSLVGPKRYDVPWKDLEGQGWIATARCVEIRVEISPDREIEYAVANQREKYRIASENPAKTPVVNALLARHADDAVLVIGQYIEQLETIAKQLNVPLITGKTPNAERDRIYGAFRSGELKTIVVSKVANFAIDLPDASVAIQISGTFGSRQEEAQRLGRILRPKDKDSHFYTIVTGQTVEEEFAANRQKFLAEQGYEYSIVRWEEDSGAITDFSGGAGRCV
ncbi:MAG TPA: helicase-associated domain-containing protein [Treponemataceae bacterium]|nr:helicase-associated domain-containing protein [Treponemataceae bacterium]HPS44834.1 helicase-associated domain-containing protein [Treponemataceae bacterium]